MADDVMAVIEEWVANGKPEKLSRRKLAFLEEVHSQTVEGLRSGMLGSPAVADGFFCGELDLPDGCYVCELVADLLDYVSKRKSATDRRLVEIGNLLNQAGFRTPKEVEG